MFWIAKEPPALVTVVYFVPEGRWVATMVAPTSGSSVAPFTDPPMAEVVICANKDEPAIKANTNKKRILLSI